MLDGMPWMGNWLGRIAAVTVVVVVVVVALGSVGGGMAEEFRVENKVFVGSEDSPHSQSMTIFRDGVVYDYLEEPAEVTVFDVQRGRFILLDTNRKIQTELSTQEILLLVARLKQWAAAQSDPFLKFMAEPALKEEFDATAAELTLSSSWLTYRVVTVDAQSDQINEQYREFSDWYCRLNTLIAPGSRPPMARLALNEALHRRTRFPSEVHLTFRPKEGVLARRITARSEHRLVGDLVESDRNRIAQTDQFMVIFRQVEFREYQEGATRGGK